MMDFFVIFLMLYAASVGYVFFAPRGVDLVSWPSGREMALFNGAVWTVILIVVSAMLSVVVDLLHT